MALSRDAVYDHLVELRSSLVESRWMILVDPPVLSLFNVLLENVQKLAPQGGAVGAIEQVKVPVNAATLLMLVDQLLVALRFTSSLSGGRSARISR